MKLKINAFAISFFPFAALDAANAGVPGGGGARGGANRLGASGGGSHGYGSINMAAYAPRVANFKRIASRAENGRVFCHRDRELHETGPPAHQEVGLAH